MESQLALLCFHLAWLHLHIGLVVMREGGIRYALRFQTVLDGIYILSSVIEQLALFEVLHCTSHSAPSELVTLSSNSTGHAAPESFRQGHIHLGEGSK